MSNTENVAEKKKRFRSPPYPMFDLGKAIDRATEVFKQAHHHEVGVQVLSDAWGMKSADGRVWRAAAALIQFGLLNASGSGKTRKFQISNVALRVIQDTDPLSQKRRVALHAAALSPMIHKELWEKFKFADGLSDAVVKTYLTLDRAEGGEAAYSDSAAEEVIQTYRATLAYAEIADSDAVALPVTDKNDVIGDGRSRLNPIQIELGDYVKWTSSDIVRFASRKVGWISDDGSYLRVIGSDADIAMNEVEKLNLTANPQGQTVSPSVANDAETNEPITAKKQILVGEQGGEKLQNVATSVIGNRLQITADVNASEIDTLKAILDKYQDILKLMN